MDVVRNGGGDRGANRRGHAQKIALVHRGYRGHVAQGTLRYAVGLARSRRRRHRDHTRRGSSADRRKRLVHHQTIGQQKSAIRRRAQRAVVTRYRCGEDLVRRGVSVGQSVIEVCLAGSPHQQDGRAVGGTNHRLIIRRCGDRSLRPGGRRDAGDIGPRTRHRLPADHFPQIAVAHHELKRGQSHGHIVDVCHRGVGDARNRWKSDSAGYRLGVEIHYVDGFAAGLGHIQRVAIKSQGHLVRKLAHRHRRL